MKSIVLNILGWAEIRRGGSAPVILVYDEPATFNTEYLVFAKGIVPQETVLG